MKTQNKNKMVEWYGADRMHEMSKTWLSDLNFIKDEQVFLEELITDYTQLIIDDHVLARAQDAATALLRTKRGSQKLITALVAHENDLELMVDGKNELDKEEQYKADHLAFIKQVSSFFYDYKAVKSEIFNLVKTLMKRDKQDHLLN
ncbi:MULTISPECIES: hypothetical protein [Olleya]|uniref:Uncharacterized protein n=1 Tax=Olleya namhaensis TaxID=1144750 RepID=A0A1I3MNB4_9FLAO|nr:MULTISPECIES: hypothetical protein [Olleya]PKG52674.1 hypothetical protein CXF54_02580 [Olleya sp. 1-3]SFI98421.1 hypothetical protein SAMN05443431_103232 [Olleya namhaensis]